MGNVTILHVDWCLQCIVVSAHLSLEVADGFPNDRILTFPSGREAQYGVLLADLSSLSFVLSIPPSQAIVG